MSGGFDFAPDHRLVRTYQDGISDCERVCADINRTHGGTLTIVPDGVTC